MKIKFKHRADNYFWVTALLIFIVGLLQLAFSDSDTLDINIHDTYFVMDKFQIAYFLAFLYFILGVIYWGLYRLQLRISKKLTKLHTNLCVMGFITYLFLETYVCLKRPESPVFDDGLETYNIGVLLIVLIAILAQPILLINIIVGLVRGRTKPE